MRSRWMLSIVALVMSTALGADMSAQQQGERGGAAGGGGRGGRGGFNLPPLLMETDAFPDGGIVPARFTGRGGTQPDSSSPTRPRARSATRSSSTTSTSR